MTSEGIITQQGKRIHYPTLSNRERVLEVKNANLQRYITTLLEHNATLARRVRELEQER